MLENIPHIPLPVCKIIHDLSYMMLYDDRHDIGFFQYARVATIIIIMGGEHRIIHHLPSLAIQYLWNDFCSIRGNVFSIKRSM